jgi:hypothetical protein
VSLPLESVREQLLRAGIAPRHVNRYVVELREHLADLTARERQAGLDAKAAGERARALLGSETQLVQAMIEKTPRSLAVRAPWVVFTLLPVVALVLAIAAVDVGMYRLLSPLNTQPGGVPISYDGMIAAVSFAASYLLGPALAAGCILLALRQRLASSWVWVGLGLIALVSGMFGFYRNAMPAGMGHLAGTTFSALPVVLVDGRVSPSASLSLVAGRAIVLFAIAAVAFTMLRAHFLGRRT